MTVFIIQAPAPNNRNWVPDFSPALKYGEIRFIFEAQEKIYASSAASLEKARQILSDFNPDTDYILWPNTGDQIALYLVTKALYQLGVEDYSVLKWDRIRNDDGSRDPGKGFYIPVHI